MHARFAILIVGATLLFAPAASPQARKEPVWNGHTLSYWVEGLKNDKVEMRRTSASALASLIQPYGSNRIDPRGLERLYPEAFAALLDAAGDRDDSVRGQVIRTLSDCKSEKINELLRDRLRKDLSTNVRTYSAVGLGKFPREKSVLPLMEALTDDEADVRAAAAKALENFGPSAKGAAAQLAKALRDKSERVRIAAAEAMVAIIPDDPGEAVSELLDDTKSKDESIRERAATCLGTVGKNLPQEREKVAAGITTILKDPKPGVRRAATRSLAKLGPAAKPAIPSLVANLADKDPDVRSETIRVLAGLGPEAKAAAAPLAELAKGLNPPAAAALQSIDPAAVPPVLSAVVRHLDDLSEQSRKSAVETLTALGPAGGAEAREALRKAMKDRSRAVAQEAAVGLQYVDAAAAMKLIQQSIKDLDDAAPTARADALVTLALFSQRPERYFEGEAKAPEDRFPEITKEIIATVPRLTKSLRDDNSTVRKNALLALRAIDYRHLYERVLPDLLEDLRDKDLGRRRAATDIVCQMAPISNLNGDANPVLRGLKLCLKDDEMAIQVQALQTLGALAPQGVPNELKQLVAAAVGDKDGRVRSAAGTALKKLDPEAATKLGLR
jgi:HEAT repeat protein